MGDSGDIAGLSAAQGGLEGPSAPSLPLAGRDLGCQAACGAVLVLAVASPVLAACLPSCGFPKEHFYECLLQQRKLTHIKADELCQIQFQDQNWRGIDFGRQPSCSVNYKCLYRHFE